MHRTTFSAVNPAGQIPPMPRVAASVRFRLVASILQEYYRAVARSRDEYFLSNFRGDPDAEIVSQIFHMRRLDDGGQRLV